MRPMIPASQLVSKLEEYEIHNTYDKNKKGHGPDDHIANLFCTEDLPSHELAENTTSDEIWLRKEQDRVFKDAECFKCKVKGFKSKNCYDRHLV